MEEKTNKYQRAMEKLAKNPNPCCVSCGKDFASQEHTLVGELVSTGAMAVVCITCERTLKRIHGGGIYCRAGEKPCEKAQRTHPIHGYMDAHKTIDHLVELAKANADAAPQ